MAIFSNTVKAINKIFFDSINSKKEITDSHEENISEEPSTKKTCDCIATDFTDEMLMMEIMRLGHDPANYTKDQMMKIIFDKMDQNKPLTINVDEAKQNKNQLQQ